MSIRNRLFGTVILFLICISGFGQNLSNRGREFYVGYGHHQFHEAGSNTQEMVLYLSAEQPATVTVTINGTSYSQVYNVPANSVISTLPIPKAGIFDARLYDGGTSEGIFDRSIKITSDVPIVAYSHIYGSASSGATMLMPTETWGYSYLSVNSRQVYATNCFSWFFVVAKENNTKIEVTPSEATRGGKPADVPFTVVLNKGQIYQILGALQSGSEGFQLTGTSVKSIANSEGVCHPIAAFSGSSRTSNNALCGSGGGDNDMQQLFPSQAWGKKYLLAPTSTSTNASAYQTNTYKIIVQDPLTVVKRGPVTLPYSSLINNTYYQFESGSAQIITADKPIMVAQFMTGGNCMGGGSNVGDPEMIIVSPVEQGIKRIGFYKNNLQAINVSYLTMIIPIGGLSSLTIDGQSYPAGFTASYAHTSAPGYQVVIKRWSPSTPGQCIVQSDSAFTAITYGLGSVESYGYNAGTNINNLNVIGSLTNTPDSTVNQHPFTCINTPIKISMSVAYPPTSMTWLLSGIPQLSPNANVTVNNPVYDSTHLVNGVTYYHYSLPGTYTFSDTGTYNIQVRNTHPSIENCNNSEIVNFALQVKAKPIINFTHVHTGCVKDTVQFNTAATTINNYNINSWKWNFPDGTTSNVQNPTKLFSTVGSKQVNLQIVTAQGCLGDTTKTINIVPVPTATFGSSSLSFCEGNSVSFTDTSSFTGTGSINSWYWDFGNSQIVNATSNAGQLTTYPTYGTYTVKHVVKVSANCVSDTASKVITVFAKPLTAFTFPVGCLPANGVVQFNNTTTAPDGQTINHSWNFGDPNATAANPNTSTVQSPSHTYQLGTYTINYSATTVNGCTRDTSVTTTFNVSPDVAYGTLNAICENVAGTISLASGQVANNMPGTGVYSGPGVTAQGQFSPSLAGAGTHTIWFTFTNSGGCKDSASTTIQVHAKPVLNLNFPVGCLPSDGVVQFNNTTSVSDGQTLSHAWNFGDPNATGANPNTSTLQSPSHTYQLGTYTINYSATTSNGCVKDTSITTTFNVSPDVTYGPLSPVCQSLVGTVSIASGQVANNMPGTPVYSGPGVTAQGQFSPSVAGPGTHTIWFHFTNSGGCKDSASTTILVHAKPVTNISFPVGCLPSDGIVQFTNNTSVSDGQTLSHSWNFGDPNANGSNPNTSTLQNPSHIFTLGTYTINYTATTNNGCTRDTTITTTFNVSPEVTYGPLASVCQSTQGTVSIASGQVTNNVSGTGIYKGPGVSANGAFSPSTAGPGIHTIWFVYTSGGGCKDSASATIKVHPKPTASFTGTNVCVGTTTTFTDASTLSSGNIVSWNWNFGNGNTINNSNGNPFTYTYGAANNYTVKLVAVSDSSCTSDTAVRTITIYPKPVPNFTMPAYICMPNGNAVFTNTSTVTGGGALSYDWNFGDNSNASNATNPSHVYATSGPFTVSLTATSIYGCTEDTSKILDVFYDKPVANFQVAPDALCQGENNVFTDLSTAPNSTVSSWSWTFGDNSNSTLANPTKQYAQAGQYAVSLVVKNAVGCTSDPFIKNVTVYVQPKIDAGPNYIVPEGTVVKFNPTVNDSTSVSFLWTPSGDFADPTLLRPTIAVTHNQTYTLTATGDGNCTDSDTMFVRILRPITIPNSFSPNGDGINDTWVIPNLTDYLNCKVEVFNRYGQVVFQSSGYGKPWDGTYKGTQVPFATYYYIITLNNGGFQPVTGSVTIVR